MNGPAKPTDATSAMAALESAPAIGRIRRAVRTGSAYVVGGTVRDALLGIDRTDLDVAIEGDAIELARSVGDPARVHDSFGTATVELDGLEVDLAATRSETYAQPGALPNVEWPVPLAQDLSRRDFSVNAMALPLQGRAELIDPHSGHADLESGVLRVLHPASIADDPTRALRAARYAARLGFELESQTAELIGGADLETVSPERVAAEMRRAAREPDPCKVFGLLASWGLAGVDNGAPARIKALLATLRIPGWDELVDREETIVNFARLSPELETAALRLAAAHPERPSDAADLASGREPLELIAGRTAGGAWLDEWLTRVRAVALEINGDDLIEAGVSHGPQVGRGLTAALRAKRDGEAPTREDELRIALAAARLA